MSLIEQLERSEFQQPEPLLTRFLKKFVIEASVIQGDEIYISAATPQNQRRKTVRKFITLEEFDRTEEWLSEHSEIAETPLVHVNMELLRGQRAKIPLSAKPVF